MSGVAHASAVDPSARLVLPIVIEVISRDWNPVPRLPPAEPA